MRKSVSRLVMTALICITLFCTGTQTVWASGEQISFGSDLYEWSMDTGNTFFFGVYASADAGVSAVDFDVCYDPDMLELVSGGTYVEPGRVKVQASGTNESEWRRMLSFRPLQGGNTLVWVENAQITETGKTAAAAADQSVPVHIDVPEDLRLSGITVNGNAIENFDAAVTEYSLEVTSDVETAQISVLPETANVEISDTTLQTGENTITIVTSDAAGKQARYLLHVNRQEVSAASDETTDAASGEQPSEEKLPETEQQNIKISRIAQMRMLAAAHKKWVLTLGALILLLIVLQIIKIYVKKNRYHSLDKNKIIVDAVDLHERQKRKLEEQKRKQNNLIYGDDEPLKIADLVETPFQENPEREAEQEVLLEINQLSEEDKTYVSDELPEEKVEIEVDHVTIDFKRDTDEAGSVKELVIRTLTGKRHVNKFRALNDISFRVMEGEVVGIIGTNGSGKSTMLKIISGALAPTEGTVKTDRKKIQLLTLGTGFDMELTGRENVYLNGAIIGYTKEFIDEHYNAIVEFAELDGFMDEKVKNYSSGMVSRLGFAIATVRDTPEILILDEVLSVGDMFFRKKSEQRIQEMIHGGSTVLIVSHSPSVIRKNCTKVIWIERGHLKAIGDPKTVCAAYEKMSQG